MTDPIPVPDAGPSPDRSASGPADGCLPVFVRPDRTLPPPPPGVRYVRVPFARIIATDDVRARVARWFHGPMIVLALAILPLLFIEIVKQPTGPLDRAIRTGFLVIWSAFVLEFALKMIIADSRIDYLRRNWLDVIIILVPMLRVFKAKLVVVKTARALKLRGVAMKMARTIFTVVIGMEATDRVLERFGLKQTGEVKPEAMTREQLSDEVRRSRRGLRAWRRWHGEYEAYMKKDLVEDGEETQETGKTGTP